MPVGGDFGDEPTEPVDRLVIALRAFVRKAPKKPKKGSKPPRTTLPGAVNWRDLAPRATPSDWVLVFDCETRTSPDQRLRFGGYQLRYKGEVWERGAFYEPDVLSEDELAILRQFIAEEDSNSDGERICLRTRAEFVDEVFYQSGQAVGAQIVGFNLPFDLSRLAIRYSSARGVTPPRTKEEIQADAPKNESNRTMAGGFSLRLSEDWPPVGVKHLSQRSALIRFMGNRRETEATAEEDSDDDPEEEVPDETEKKPGPDRGYFVDVKTLAAALTSKSHSLASLSDLLKVPTPKKESDEHGGALTPEYVRYGLRDVQTTWECFDHLARRFAGFGLNDTGLYELYSEASLGKAYLRAMGIKPWQEVQRGFPLHLVGAIMSAYFGGRAEVHIRRQITSLVEVVGRGINCLAGYVDGLEPLLRALWFEAYRPDHLRRPPCENLGREHVGKREPLRLVGAEIVEPNVEGVASRVFCPDREEVIPRPHLNQRGQVFPTVLLAQMLQQLLSRSSD